MANLRTKQILASEGNIVIDENLSNFEQILNLMEEELMQDEPSIVKISNLHGKLTGFYREILFFRERFGEKQRGRKKRVDD